MPPLDPTSSASLGAVARAAGVSTMTVSRVFRDSPQVLQATRNRVLAAAKKTGYRPDPQVARLMALVRSHRVRRVRVPLAVIRDDTPVDELHAPTYHYVTTDDILNRAEQHGYRVEEFWLGRNGIGPARLGRILSTRGITGVLVSVQSTRQFSAQFNYDGLAAATFGYGLATPQLHRASTNMTQGILSAAALLEARDYRRIGMAISPWIDTRAGHTYSGAWLHYQQTVADAHRVPLLLFPQNSVERSERIFSEWMSRHRPDAVISFHAPILRWLTQGMGLRIPEDVGLVVHDWVPSMTGFAGIDHRRAHVAAAAVDLVATQLQHNEHGVPEVPRQILIPPRLIDGPSIRQ